MITCIIVDDMKDMIELLEMHVKAMPELELKATFVKPLEALEYLKHNAIDLVFLDIEMPKLNGLDFIGRLRSQKSDVTTAFILTTGFTQYAIDSYEYGVTDYILKPVTFKRFNLAVNKFLNSHKVEIITETKIDKGHFFFADNQKGQKIKINWNNIHFIESTGNYVSIYLEKERITIYKTIQSLKEALPESEFIRVHKSYIVSLDKVEAIINGELMIRFYKDKGIPIGPSYKAGVLKRLNIL